MTKIRTILFVRTIDNNYTSDKNSIVVPSNVRKIVSICPNMVNGSGFISIFSENNEECLLNQMRVSDDNAHFNKKNVEVFTLNHASNMYYIFNLIDTDINKPCKLKIIITYEEEDFNG